MIRLNKFIAENSRYSRRDADKLIAEGQVRLNGKIAQMGSKVDPEKDSITLMGKEFIKQREYTYMAFYKPKAVLTTYEQKDEKRTLEDFRYILKGKPAYSGRLDYNSEGLILFSSDGSLIQRLQKHMYGVEKEYLVAVDSNLTDGELNQLKNGITFEDETYKKCKIEKVDDKVYKLILTEGKNRQIRNMFRYFNIRVKRLMRIRIANIELGKLKPGEYRMLDQKEIMELKKCTGSE